MINAGNALAVRKPSDRLTVDGQLCSQVATFRLERLSALWVAEVSMFVDLEERLNDVKRILRGAERV